MASAVFSEKGPGQERLFLCGPFAVFFLGTSKLLKFYVTRLLRFDAAPFP